MVKVMLAARQEVLPEWARPEERGETWGVEKRLLDAYAKHGYMWSDAIYDRDLTLSGLGTGLPVIRSSRFTEYNPLAAVGGVIHGQG
jgi:hypothetical protein